MKLRYNALEFVRKKKGFELRALRSCCKVKGMLSKFLENPCFCFRYRLSYNYPNELILIGK